MILVARHCCMQSDSTQMYPGKNKVIPEYNIGKKKKQLSTIIKLGNSLFPIQEASFKFKYHALQWEECPLSVYLW